MEPHVLLALWDPPLKVEGEMALELMCGEEAISLGLRFNNVPCFVPWEILKSPKLHVLEHSEALRAVARSGRVGFSWLGTPCRSMTLARKPELRSWDLPMGRCDLSAAQADLVSIGNALAFFTVEFAWNF